MKPSSRSVDQARLRPHLREYKRAAAPGVDTALPAAKVPTGDDRQRLCGLPCIAREVTGAQPGSDPVLELLRKEARQERRR